MMIEWMTRKMESNERMKDQFEYLEKIQPSKSHPHTINTKSRHEFVYNPPSVQNNDKGDVKAIKEDKTEPILTMPNPSPIMSNSPTVSPFLKDCTVHIPYMNAKTFANDVLSNHVGDKELKSTRRIGNGVLAKKEIKKDETGLPKELNKEWKLKEKVQVMEEDDWSTEGNAKLKCGGINRENEVNILE
ncbi:hypothetical protein Tco_0678020 [Tanacetum coccineum]|uniref:Uncharacterized protein n=1 Tax=Tanacetum coccineum TaxID=301880 RepID=A0ABQ4XE28_9ASTR